jgi:hypothetical protein
MDSLRLSVLTPHSYDMGCRCRECLGLAEYMRGLTGKSYGLPRTEAPLRPVALPLTPSEPCSGTMTCECPKCAQERSERVRRPPKEPRQPWMPKAA